MIIDWHGGATNRVVDFSEFGTLDLPGLLHLAISQKLPWPDELSLLQSLPGASVIVRVLKIEDASVVAPLLTFSPVFTVLIAAVFLGEIPSIRGLIGIGFLLVGAYWLTVSSREEWLSPLKPLTLKQGVLLVLFAGLLWAITPILEKTAIQHTHPSSPRFAAFIIDLLLVLTLTTPALRRDRISLPSLRLHRQDLLVAGLIAGSAPVLGYTAFSLGPVGYVTTLFRFSAVITVVWGALFLKEHDLQRRLPAALLMVAGAILLAV